MPDLIIFAIGLAAAVRGADWVGRSAISIAKKYQISQITIGATLVSLATTLPEISSASFANFINKDPSIGVGTILGSLLVNIGIILGLFFLVSKKRPTLGYYSRSVNILISISFLLLIISINSSFGGFISIFLILLGLTFLTLESLISRHPNGFFEVVESRFEKFLSLFDFSKDKKIYLELVFGSILLALGSKFTVDSVFALSRESGLSEFFISITLLAVGTSLPELLTAINSFIFKRESIAVGNLIGASVIDLTIGTGFATLGRGYIIAYPTNFLILVPLILLGVFSLLVLFKKIPVPLIGAALFFTAIISLFLFTYFEVLK